MLFEMVLMRIEETILLRSGNKTPRLSMMGEREAGRKRYELLIAQTMETKRCQKLREYCQSILNLPDVPIEVAMQF